MTNIFEKKNNKIVIHRKPNKNNFYDIGTVHMSKLYGPFKILDNRSGKSPNGSYLFTIKFLLSGYIVNNVRKDHIKDGHIKDYSYNIQIGDVLKSTNYGYFKILHIVDKTSHNILYRIKFIGTEYETNAWLSNIKSGNIIDPLYRRVRGIGYLGRDFKILRHNDPDLYKALKSKWESMIDRCYSNRNSNSYNSYGKIGITVDERWHNFCNFYIDSQKLYGFNREKIINTNKLQLDKDFKQISIPKNKRIYSKDTCIWLSPKDNTSIRDIERMINKKQVQRLSP